VIFADPYGGVWLQRSHNDFGTGSGFLSATFTHFAVTYDGTDVRWYVNGILRSTQAASFPTNADASDLQIGKGDFYGNNELDEVAIYGTALSAARIAAHYTAGT
jgi:Concanavalin A-like lectin/glucanases superfamily